MDTISQNDLTQFKEYVTNIYVAFNQINKENRDKKLDFMFLNTLRNNALSIFDKCNKIMILQTNNQNNI